MPAEGIHLTSLREARVSERLAPGARAALVRFEDHGRAGAVLLDLPYFDRYALEVVRYAARRPPRPSPVGAEVHARAAIPIALALLDEAREAGSQALAALALGVVSHAKIDRTLHPLINALAAHHGEGADHDAAHREVEKFQSICFHEEHFGRDRMGTPGIVALVHVPFGEVMRPSVAGRAIAGAYGSAMTAAPSFAELVAMARGYEQHAWLLGTVIGKRVAPERAKERARPRYLRGRWGTFAGALEHAIAASVPVLDLAWAYFEARGTDGAAAREALLSLLPPGSIDDPGDPALLDRPFVPATPV